MHRTEYDGIDSVTKPRSVNITSATRRHVVRQGEIWSLARCFLCGRDFAVRNRTPLPVRDQHPCGAQSGRGTPADRWSKRVSPRERLSRSGHNPFYAIYPACLHPKPYEIRNKRYTHPVQPQDVWSHPATIVIRQIPNSERQNPLFVQYCNPNELDLRQMSEFWTFLSGTHVACLIGVPSVDPVHERNDLAFTPHNQAPRHACPCLE